MSPEEGQRKVAGIPTERSVRCVVGGGEEGRWLLNNFYLSFLVMLDHTESHIDSDI